METANPVQGLLDNALLGAWLSQHNWSELPPKTDDPELITKNAAEKARLTAEFQVLYEADQTRISALQAHELEKCYAAAGTHLLGLGDNIGQAFLKLLWDAYQRGLFLYSGENGAEYNDLVDWAAANIIYHDPEYVRSFARTVERMLQDIHKKAEGGDPYVLTPDGQVVTRETVAAQNDGELPSRSELLAMGEVLTPETLIDMPKMVKRLKEQSYIYQESDEGQRAALLSTMIVAANKQTVKKKVEEVQAGNGNIRYRPIIKNRSDGLCDLVVEGLPASDLDALLVLMRPMIKRY